MHLKQNFRNYMFLQTYIGSAVSFHWPQGILWLDKLDIMLLFAPSCTPSLSLPLFFLIQLMHAWFYKPSPSLYYLSTLFLISYKVALPSALKPAILRHLARTVFHYIVFVLSLVLKHITSSSWHWFCPALPIGHLAVLGLGRWSQCCVLA